MIITTAVLNNNKPAVELDWAGQPMKEGGFYGGRPEKRPPLKPYQKGLASMKPRSEWSPEQLAAARQRMDHARAQRFQRKAGATASSGTATK